MFDDADLPRPPGFVSPLRRVETPVPIDTGVGVPVGSIDLQQDPEVVEPEVDDSDDTVVGVSDGDLPDEADAGLAEDSGDAHFQLGVVGHDESLGPELPVGRVIEGDCIEVMRTLPPNSIDAIVTDPPYGLAFMSAEFDDPKHMEKMLGKHSTGAGVTSSPGIGERDVEWPSNAGWNAYRCNNCGHLSHGGSPCGCAEPDFVPADNRWLVYQQWTEMWAREAHRILKPGGHLIAFGGTRTHHRQTVAIEDAGFEIRDEMQWIYLCLSQDTEVLTERGWVGPWDCRDGELVASFDVESGYLQWQPIASVHRYFHEGDMVEVGPQLVTLNHRVVLEAAREPQVPLPDDEDMWDLLDVLRRLRPVHGRAQADVFAAVPQQVDWTASVEEARVYDVGATGLLHVREGVRQTAVLGEGQSGGVLLDAVQWQATGREPALPQPSEDMDGGSEGKGKRGLLGRRKPSLAGRRFRTALAWELLGGDIPARTRVGLDDGPEGRLGDGAQAGHGNHVRIPVATRGGGQPREPQPSGQQAREPDTLAEQCDPQDVRVGEVPDRHRQSDPVRRVSGYSGLVWCVTVASGAFVARRNGIAFVTGNSGMPKSRDTAKDIDRIQGQEREVLGTKHVRDIRRQPGRPVGWGLSAANRDKDEYIDHPITAASSDDAKKWSGYGTNLKPAHEPIILARKPLVGSVARNVLQYGTGALNIDGTRIGTTKNVPASPSRTAGTALSGSVDGSLRNEDGTGSGFDPNIGRWPSNVMLTDNVFDGGVDGVVGGGERSSGIMKAGTQRSSRSVDYGKMPDTANLTDTYGDSGGVSRYFVIPKASRSEKEPNWHGIEAEFLGAEAGNSVGPMAGRGEPGLKCRKCHRWKVSGNPCRCEEPDFEQTAFVRPRVWSDHPTVKPLDLMCHLVRLVCPPGGVCLDPFLGSGTTAKACELEGRQWIGIERDAHFASISRARLEGTQQGLGLE